MRPLEEIEADTSKASEGPWIAFGFGSTDATVRKSQPDGWPDDPVGFLQCGANVDNAENDARFIAAARTDVPDLCAKVRKLEAGIRAAISDLSNQDAWAQPRVLDTLLEALK